MKIISLTPGTGSFHCGSCIRDNTLVLALRELGHDVLMVPLYLPFVADEDTSEGVPVFLGGVNAYLQQKSSIFRKMPKWMDKIFDANFLLRKVSHKAGMTSPRDLGEMTVSTLKGLEGFQKKEIAHLVKFIQGKEKPDVIMISNVLLTGLIKPLKEVVDCKIAVTLQGEDTFLDTLPDPWGKESWDLIKRNCEDADLFFPVSHYHHKLMNARLNLPEEKVKVVYNGLKLADFKCGEFPKDPPVLGMLSRLIPGKGLDILTEAYIHLRDKDLIPGLKLKVAGSKTKSEEAFINSIKDKLRVAGYLDDVDFAYNISEEEKIEFLAGLTLFSTPAEYGESFGLYVIEAVASGLPVIQPDSAAFPELLGHLDCGTMYKTGDPVNLAEQIAAVYGDLDAQKERAAKGAAKVKSEFSEGAMADTIAGHLEKLFS